MGGLYIIGWMHVIMTCWYRSDGLSDGAELKADFCTNSTRGKECLMLYHLPSKITWNEAAEFCTSVDSVLASILDSHIQEKMRAVFQSASINPYGVPYAWIGGREQIDDTWRWLDGSAPKSTTSLPNSDYRTCVHLSMAGDAPELQPLECRLTKRAFLCKNKHTGCIMGDGFSSAEIFISNKSYCSYNQDPAVSWYEANNLCKKYGGMLASVPFITESRVERRALMVNLTSLQNGDTWVGLRRRRWKWEYIHELMEAPALFIYTNWRSGEPNDADQRCSYVDRWDKWADGKCEKKLSYTICHNITNIENITISAQTSPGTTAVSLGSNMSMTTKGLTKRKLEMTSQVPNVGVSKDDTIAIISTLLALVTVALLVIIILFVVVIRRTSGKNRTHDVEITEITRTTRNSNNTENNGLSPNYEAPGLEANASAPHDYAELASGGYAKR